MIVEKGLLEHGVLQRTKENKSDVRFAGTGDADGAVQAYVTGQGQVVPGFDGVTVGEVTGGELRGRLMDLPVGGPYDVTLRVKDSAEQTTIRDLLVGDLWVLAGQSNMEGCGARWEALKPDPSVRAYYMDDHWDVAEDPLHDLSIAVAPVHQEIDGPRQPQPTRGTGLGVSFGQERFRAIGVPVGLIACAHGGTSMRQWSPALREKGGSSLYGAAIQRVNRNGGKVAGLVWYQGCSDTNPTDSSPVYTERMMDLIGAFRGEFGDRTFPVAVVQIGPHRTSDADDRAWSEIRRQQYDLPCHVPHLTLVSAIDLTLADMIHISGTSSHRLGKRVSQAIAALVDGEGPGPIRATVIGLQKNPIHDGTDILVRFSNLAGNLVAPWQPLGFTLVGFDGRIAIPFNTDLAGDVAIIRTMESREAMQELMLYYGYGANVYCNITDEADRAVPAFGPVLLAE